MREGLGADLCCVCCWFSGVFWVALGMWLPEFWSGSNHKLRPQLTPSVAPRIAPQGWAVER